MKKIKTMNNKIILAICLCAGVASCSPKINVQKVVSDAESQARLMLHEIPKAQANNSALTQGGTPGNHKGELVSPRTMEDGELRLVRSGDWTSGFFPGVLWYLHAQTGKEDWKAEAEKYTAPLEQEKWNAGTHDMGFKVYCSFGNGYLFSGNQHYKDVIIQSAKTLATRFNPAVGAIRSWDFRRNQWGFPVIIDNMLNLELLFAATRVTGDSSYHKIAVSHANKTLQNHFRPNYSTWHVIDYDTINGKAVQKHTHQGHSHESTWARGMSWALYGFTMSYRFTKDPAYLKQAESVANFILTHKNLPADLIPYWDFDAPKIPNEPRDASAAAINASALYELSLYSNNGAYYRKTADKILASLVKKYRSPVGENKGWILLHSTGSYPHNSEIDVPLSYADYYFIEALYRHNKLKKDRPLF